MLECVQCGEELETHFGICSEHVVCDDCLAANLRDYGVGCYECMTDRAAARMVELIRAIMEGAVSATWRPKAYLSVYTTHMFGREGERVWQVHFGSSPLCAPTDESTARHIWADHRRLITNSVTQRHLLGDWPEIPPVWDGDTETWAHLSDICREPGCDRFAKKNGTGLCYLHDYIN